MATTMMHSYVGRLLAAHDAPHRAAAEDIGSFYLGCIAPRIVSPALMDEYSARLLLKIRGAADVKREGQKNCFAAHPLKGVAPAVRFIFCPVSNDDFIVG